VTIVEEIVNLKQRLSATSVIVTHDRDLAFSVADRIAMIDAGQILAVGRPDEIRRHPDPAIQKFLTIEFPNANKRTEP